LRVGGGDLPCTGGRFNEGEDDDDVAGRLAACDCGGAVRMRLASNDAAGALDLRLAQAATATAREKPALPTEKGCDLDEAVRDEMTAVSCRNFCNFELVVCAAGPAPGGCTGTRLPLIIRSCCFLAGRTLTTLGRVTFKFSRRSRIRCP